MSWQMPKLDDRRRFLSGPPPKADWVIEGLKSGDVGILSAPGGTGKSMFCLSLMSSVAGGQPLFGAWAVGTRGDVLYMYSEDDSDTVWARTWALNQISPLDPADDARQHSVCVRVKTPKLMVRGEDRSGIAQACTDAVAQIMSVVKGFLHPRLLILDPLIKFHTLDENNNSEMEQFMSLMVQIATELGVAILLTHHVGKSAVLNGQSTTQQSARGASAIIDQARWQVALNTLDAKSAGKLGIPEADAWKYLTATNPKINGAARLPDLLLERGPDGVLMRSEINPTPTKNRSHLKVVRRVDDFDEGVPIDEE